jgi:hypothetical protein
MSLNGEDDLAAARAALLDALDALRAHIDSVIVVGAQAIYLQTGGVRIALAESTKDSDLALDTRLLPDRPLVEEAMLAAGFRANPESGQPGAWLSPAGIPVDLMVAESQAGSAGRRGARIPPHSKLAARRASGLEGALVDHTIMEVRSLAPGDGRRRSVKVAGPAAMMVAKSHKLGERRRTPGRLLDKDAHDVYRLLVAVPTPALAARIERLRADPVSAPATATGLRHFAELFAAGPDALGSAMAARAEGGHGDATEVAVATAVLAGDLLAAVQVTAVRN